MTFQIGDGNDLEDTGLLAMLQRRAKRIVSLINGPGGLVMSPDFCIAGSQGYRPTGKELTTQFANFFGYGNSVDPVSHSFHMFNQVFSSSEYLPVLCELQRLKRAGKAQVLRRTMAVQGNSWWGIQGGWNIDIVFSLLDTAAEFEQSLPVDVQQALRSGLLGGLDGFPNMKTVFQNPPDLTQYTARQINLLAAQTEW